MAPVIPVRSSQIFIDAFRAAALIIFSIHNDIHPANTQCRNTVCRQRIGGHTFFIDEPLSLSVYSESAIDRKTKMIVVHAELIVKDIPIVTIGRTADFIAAKTCTLFQNCACCEGHADSVACIVVRSQIQKRRSVKLIFHHLRIVSESSCCQEYGPGPDLHRL